MHCKKVSICTSSSKLHAAAMNDLPASLGIGHETSNSFAKCESRISAVILSLSHNCYLHADFNS